MPLYDSIGVKALENLLEDVRKKRQDIDTVLDIPSWVCYTVIVDSIFMFHCIFKRPPTVIHLPRTVELLLDAYSVKHVYHHKDPKSLRTLKKFLGLRVEFDADRFHLSFD